jgi:hypothetical protein
MIHTKKKTQNNLEKDNTTHGWHSAQYWGHQVQYTLNHGDRLPNITVQYTFNHGDRLPNITVLMLRQWIWRKQTKKLNIWAFLNLGKKLKTVIQNCQD